MNEKTTAKYKLKDYSNFNLTFPEVASLLDKIELIKRRKIKDNTDPINYIDPLNNVKTLKNPVNHLIIGRRGAGKTSLLLKVIEEIRKTNGLITIIDMQGKPRQSADLPLVEVLINLFNDLKINLEDDSEWKPYLHRKTKIKYYKLKSLYYGLISKDLWTKKIMELDKLYHKIQSVIHSLDLIKSTQNGSEIKISNHNKNKSSSNSKTNFFGSISADSKYLKIIQLSATTEFNFIILNEKENNKENSIEYTGIYSKQEALEALKQEIIKCIDFFNEIIKRPIYLILDDFYQIPIDNQPFIFQYLHDLNKETPRNAFSYKACLVPNRFKLNEDSNKILSHKDDFSTINLDRDFCELDANKDLLFKIICSIDPDLNFTTAKINKLFNDTLVVNDCIRASGALPRYFLDVFCSMVKYSLAENQSKIHRMVFSQVVREIKKSKDSLISEEAYLPEEVIRRLSSVIDEEVVHGLQTNVILYPYNSFKENEEILNTLINLGYIHRIKESIIVEKSNYIPIFIDMTFTHTKSDKMPKNFKDVKFWEKDGKVLLKCQIWEFKKEHLLPLNIN